MVGLIGGSGWRRLGPVRGGGSRREPDASGTRGPLLLGPAAREDLHGLQRASREAEALDEQERPADAAQLEQLAAGEEACADDGG